LAFFALIRTFTPEIEGLAQCQPMVFDKPDKESEACFGSAMTEELKHRKTQNEDIWNRNELRGTQ
jgi:hypothetical protein